MLINKYSIFQSSALRLNTLSSLIYNVCMYLSHGKRNRFSHPSIYVMTIRFLIVEMFARKHFHMKSSFPFFSIFHKLQI